MENTEVVVAFTPKYPWEWTPLEAVQFLSDLENPPLKQYFECGYILASVFIDQEIDGATLLSELCNEKFLRKVLGIDRLGVRVAILRVLDALRERYPCPSVPPFPFDSELLSREYLEYSGLGQQNETIVFDYGATVNPVLTEVHVTPARQTLLPGPSNPLKRVSPSNRRLDDDNDIYAPAFNITGSSNYNTPSKLHASRTPGDGEDGDEEEDDEEPNLKRPRIENPNTTDDESVGMELILASDGTNEDFEEPPETQDMPTNADDEVIDESLAFATASQLSIEEPPLVELEALETIELPPLAVVLPERKRKTSPRVPPQIYLENIPMTAQDITLGVENPKDNDNWSLVPRRKAPGAVRAINSIQQRFLGKKPTQYAKVRGETMLAYRPYSVRYVNRYQRVPVTTISKSRVSPHQDLKVHISDFPELDIADGIHRKKRDRIQLMDLQNPVNSTYLDPYRMSEDYFNALEAKWTNIAEGREKDNFVDIYYDGDDSPGLDDDTLVEMQKDMARDEEKRRRRNNTPLGADEITTVFAETSALIVERWNTKDLPRLEKKAYRIWVQGRRKVPGLEASLGVIKKEIEHIQTRIETQKQRYLTGTWFSRRELEKQIRGSSRPSIEQREELLFKDSIIRGSRPPKPERKLREPATAPVLDSAEEEDLRDEDMSEFDDEEEDDGIDDFIVPDDLETLEALQRLRQNDNEDDIDIRDAPAPILVTKTSVLPAEEEVDAAGESAILEEKPHSPVEKISIRPVPASAKAEPKVGRSSDTYEWFSTDKLPASIQAPTDAMTSTATAVVRTLVSPITPLSPVIKDEPVTTPISFPTSMTEVIDLTIDDDTPISTPSKAKGSVSVGSSSKIQTVVDLSDSGDEGLQRAIMNSLRKTQGSRHPDGTASPSCASISHEFVNTEKIATAMGPQDGLTWTQHLERMMKADASIVPPLQEIVRQERPRLLNKVIWTFDRLEKTISDKEAEKRGISPKDVQMYKLLARLYVKRCFPHEPPERATIAADFHFRNFVRGLKTMLANFVTDYSSPKPSSVIKDATSERSRRDNETIEIEIRSAKGKGKERARLMSDSEAEFEPSPTRNRPSPELPPSQESDTDIPSHRVVKRRVVAESAKVRERRLEHEREARNAKSRAKRQDPSQQEDIVNPSRYKAQSPIYFPVDKEKELYPFQKEAIQFMWKNVVSSSQKSGVLLAHTMGMGKTRQVITLLGLMAETAASEDKNLYEQIPEHLRKMRALVVAPPGLLENWREEVTKWGFEHVLETRILSYGSLEDKWQIVQDWVEHGAVLLVGYGNLVELVGLHAKYKRDLENLKSGNPSSKTKSNRQLGVEELEARLALSRDLEKWLLETPSIVVADEAHKLKNGHSQTAAAFQKFATTSRIAMTGSPLANNLTEYYNIMKWVDQDYLGGESEFNSNYKFPIEDGLYAESGKEQISQSNVKLNALRKILNMKMHRCNIAVIKDKLPRKTEFLISLPLTKLQMDIYQVYTKEVRSEIKNEVKGFFDFIHQLSVLLNHPTVFWKTLKKRIEKGTGKAVEVSTCVSPSARDLEDGNALTTGVDRDAAEEAVGEVNASIFDAIQTIIEKHHLDIDDPIYSYRILALMKIITACINIREKVLVFSHSIPTLDYIQGILQRRRIDFVRLDGKVTTSNRQKLAKNFKDGDALVFLISTKAGGLGLNIQSANRIVIFDFNFSPQEEEQAVGRSYRLGQEREVYVYRFRIGGTYEDVVHNKSIFKLSLANRVVDKKNPARYAKRNTRADWFRPPTEAQQQSIEEFKERDKQVLDKLLEEEWIRGITLQETYELHHEEDLNEEEASEADKYFKQAQSDRLLSKKSRLGGAHDADFADSEMGTPSGSQSQPSVPPDVMAPVRAPELNNTQGGDGARDGNILGDRLEKLILTKDARTATGKIQQVTAGGSSGRRESVIPELLVTGERRSGQYAFTSASLPSTPRTPASGSLRTHQSPPTAPRAMRASGLKPPRNSTSQQNSPGKASQRSQASSATPRTGTQTPIASRKSSLSGASKPPSSPSLKLRGQN